MPVKRGFTLVEMLIVVAVLVTLMTITFRLSNIGSDQSRRNTTISKMQRLENCLSGYFAAFGSYPPVKLHGSRNIYLQVNNQGIQNVDGQEKTEIWDWTSIGSSEEYRAWRQVQAACLAQPVACSFPFSSDYDPAVKAVSDQIVRRATSGETRYKSYWEDPSTKARLSAGFKSSSQVSGLLIGKASKSDWREVQMFQFGLMSFLLPRYLVMMRGSDSFFGPQIAQWVNNNALPCDPFDGNLYSAWTTLKDKATASGKNAKQDQAHVANIPSQAVCARWMPNLEKTCSCNRPTTLFGIDVRDNNGSGSLRTTPHIEMYAPNGGSGDTTSDQYVLDSITVLDGWWNKFYYYSPPPYQTYVIWSGGPNGRTFPPWISREGMDSKANKCIGLWTEDDIIHMSN